MAGYPGELDFVLAIGDQRYNDAKKHLLTMISHAKEIDSMPFLAGCAQRLGDVLFGQGDEESALALYEFSEVIDKGSLLAKLGHAKFLARLGKQEMAKEKCEQIISIANDSPFAESDTDFSSKQYSEAVRTVLAGMKPR